MLIPEKNLDLNKCVLKLSWEVLKILKKFKVIKYDTLLSKSKTKMEFDINLMLLPALTFLYALGLLQYDESTDYFKISKEGDEVK